MSEPFLGQITLFPYNFAPLGWADCAGQLLPISQNSALFALIGTYYGGNGQTTFQLPNLQGNVAIGQGQLVGGNNYTMGETGGAANVTITQTTMPSHGHMLNAIGTQGTTNAPENALLASPVSTGGGGSQNKGLIYSATAANTQLTTASIGPVGGSQPHNNIQPTLAMRYCIALQGIFPSRS